MCLDYISSLMIDSSILKHFPDWYKNISPDKHYLVLTNDFDSYYSCKFLKDRFKVKVGGFYDFDRGLFLNEDRTRNKQPIYVDLCIRGMTFDNHWSIFKNPLAINPNVIVDQSKYFLKYNGSTLALIFALYDKNLSELDEETLSVLLAIDGWFIGYYNQGGKYRYVNEDWFKALGMSDYLLPILQKHDAQHFRNIIEKYRLSEPIEIDKNGRLSCEVDIALPGCKFELVTPVDRANVSRWQLSNMDYSTILTGAETYKNQCSISIRKAV